METDDLFGQYRRMKNNNIILMFKGSLSQNILVGLADVVRNKLSAKIEKNSKIKRVFSVFIELSQNIYHYSAEKEFERETGKEAGTGIITVSEDEDAYVLSSGNLIKVDRVENLVNRCQTVNRMDGDELKQHYKMLLKQDRAEGSQGGGIGLVDIARKSGRPLAYEINPVDADHSFLVITVTIAKEDDIGKSHH